MKVGKLVIASAPCELPFMTVDDQLSREEGVLAELTVHVDLAEISIDDYELLQAYLGEYMEIPIPDPIAVTKLDGAVLYTAEGYQVSRFSRVITQRDGEPFAEYVLRLTKPSA